MKAWAGVAVVVLANIFGWTTCGVATTGCGAAARYWDDVNVPQDDVDLERCREKARAAFDAGASNYRAFADYRECREDSGLY